MITIDIIDKFVLTHILIIDIISVLTYIITIDIMIYLF